MFGNKKLEGAKCKFRKILDEYVCYSSSRSGIDRGFNWATRRVSGGLDELVLKRENPNLEGCTLFKGLYVLPPTS
mgnify:CR=1 FL=1